MASLENSPCGHLVKTLDGYMAFVPDPLPRRVELDDSLIYLLDEASRAVAMLAGVGETLPNPHLLIGPFVRREAVLSSRIEGTQASLSDLFLFEASGARRDPVGDAREVANYVRALEYGLSQLERLPLSVRLVNEIHARLLERVRGRDKSRGELRTGQVWIGSEGTTLEEARFVPPPAQSVRDLLTDWELFLNEDIEMPPLVRCALMHYQFEAIHPYLDGNGRIGRLLITLFLCEKKVLPTPLLYLSAYLEGRRDEYYDQLLAVSETGRWRNWIRFFLHGVAEQAQDALLRSRRVRQLQDRYREHLQKRRESANAFRLLDELFVNPFMTTPFASKLLSVTSAGARGILQRLVDASVVEEISETWPRLYVARELLREIEQPVASVA
jgi:Fic family protein